MHRDVKTENMLLDKTRTVKIADFGVARVEASNPNDMTGETGTLGYMAPEVHILTGVGFLPFLQITSIYVFLFVHCPLVDTLITSSAYRPIFSLSQCTCNALKPIDPL